MRIRIVELERNEEGNPGVIVCRFFEFSTGHGSVNAFVTISRWLEILVEPKSFEVEAIKFAIIKSRSTFTWDIHMTDAEITTGFAWKFSVYWVRKELKKFREFV
jgi:hypothetical protein